MPSQSMIVTSSLAVVPFFSQDFSKLTVLSWVAHSSKEIRQILYSPIVSPVQEGIMNITSAACGDSALIIIFRSSTRTGALGTFSTFHASVEMHFMIFQKCIREINQQPGICAV